jgi:hypothetical protein
VTHQPLHNKEEAMVRVFTGLYALALVLSGAATAHAAAEWQTGAIELKSAGPLAFAPDGVLLVSDPMAATIYAVATDDNSGDPSRAAISVPGLRDKLAAMAGSEASDITVRDLAVNPSSGNVYLSVARGSGPESAAVIFRVSTEGEVAEFALDEVKYMQAEIPNAPQSGEDRRGRNPRVSTVTDLAFADGRVFIAGLSNEEFASKLRSIPFPFENVDAGASVEIYHGAHGGIETHSPIMTFTTYEIASEPHVVAAYTCTPLVKFPLADLKPGVKVRGTTVAELGNRNRPLDMFVYEKDGKRYILIANDSRGVMKVTTEEIDDIEGINERINGTAGLSYETIEELKGIMQLDRLNESHAVALIESDEGSQDLRTIELP